MRIVVTGATGMVGKAMVQRLLERGDDMVALTRNPAGCPAHWQGRVDCRAVEYERQSLRTALLGADAVIHLAAARPSPEIEAAGIERYVGPNLRTTEQLLQATKDERVPNFCQASSIAVYSLRNSVPYAEAERPVPLSFYGLSKIACEYLGELHSQRSSLRVVSLRIAQVLGHDERRAGGAYMLMNFIERARNRQPLTVWGSGATARDTIYIKDVLGAFERSLAPDAPAGVFNIGGGRAFSNKEVAELINDVFGNSGNLIHDYSKHDKGEIFFMDCSRAERDLGWQRRWTLRSGLEDMRRGYGERGGPDAS